MDTELHKLNIPSCLPLASELYILYEEFGNINVKAYFKTVNNKKKYYDFQILDSIKLKGSYDKLEVLELIYYLERQ